MGAMGVGVKSGYCKLEVGDLPRREAEKRAKIAQSDM